MLMPHDNAQSGGDIVRFGQSDDMTSIGKLGRSGRFFCLLAEFFFFFFFFLCACQVVCQCACECVCVLASECTYERGKN